jgi:hypothetical protein
MMNLPTKKSFLNDKLINAVMDAKGCDRASAVAHLEDKYCRMEAAAMAGKSDEEIAEAGMPLKPQEFFALMLAGDWLGCCRG